MCMYVYIYSIDHASLFHCGWDFNSDASSNSQNYNSYRQKTQFSGSSALICLAPWRDTQRGGLSWDCWPQRLHVPFRTGQPNMPANKVEVVCPFMIQPRMSHSVISTILCRSQIPGEGKKTLTSQQGGACERFCSETVKPPQRPQSKDICLILLNLAFLEILLIYRHR